jgi:hypothetical protein
LVDFNRARVREQVIAQRKACELRRFAADVRIRSSQDVAKDGRQHLFAWADWIDQEADPIDPLADEQALGFSTPEHIPPQELDIYMPTDMTAQQPPEV